METFVKSLLGRGAPWWRLLPVPLFCLVMCGCLSKARTPYNEVGLFSSHTPRTGTGEASVALSELAAPPNKTVNLWPLYNGDGRAHYIAWPFIKWSPGCFAIQPFYNHDHGIHDFLWICTLSPESGEYRLWPFFYRSPEWWMLLPLAYGSDTTYGSPLLFNRTSRFTHALNVVTWKDGGCVFPFVWWKSGKNAKMFLTPVYARIREGDNLRHRFFLNLAGYDSAPEGYSWCFPFWWSWQEKLPLQRLNVAKGSKQAPAKPRLGPRHRLLLPLFHSMTWPDSTANAWMTPLGGRGENPEQDAKWWYLLTLGSAESTETLSHAQGTDSAGRAMLRTETFRKRSRWALPLWFSREQEGRELGHWTPLSYACATPQRFTLSCGPMGLPVPFSLRQSPESDGFTLLPFYSQTKTYHTTTARSGSPERVLPKRTERNLGLGIVWSWEKTHAVSERLALPVDLAGVSRERERSRWAVLLGLAGGESVCEGQDPWGRTWLVPFWFQGSMPHSLAGDTSAERQDRWTTLFPFWWSWKIGGDVQQQNRLLFPLWFSRSYTGREASMWFTPLAGAGQDPEREARWWFALTGGSTTSRDTQVRWLMPLWWHENTPDSRTTWTPFSCRRVTAKSTEQSVGPLGFGVPFFSRQTPESDLVALNPFYAQKKIYHMTTARSGSPERVLPKRTKRELGLGMLWSWEKTHPIPERLALPVDLMNVDRRQERSRWSVLLGLAGSKHARDGSGPWGAPRDTRTHWLLPLWWHHEGPNDRTTWTLFSFQDETAGSTTQRIGPLGLGVPYCHTRSFAHEKLFILPLGTSEEAWYVTRARTGAPERLGLRFSRRTRGLGLLTHSRYWAPPTVAPIDLVGEHTEGWDWSLGFDLLAASDIHTLVGGRSIRHEASSTVGWILWRWKRNVSPNGDFRETLFSPFYRHTSTPYSLRQGLLLDAVTWSCSSQNARSFALLWDALLYYKRSPSQKTCFVGLGCLYSETMETTRWTRKKTATQIAATGQTQSHEQALLLGFPFRRTWEVKTWERERTIERKPTGQNEREYNAKGETSLLFGLLYSHTFRDWLEWEYPLGGVCPEKPTKEVSFRDTTSVLTPLVYRSETFRDGSFGRRLLFGLLYDHTSNVREKTESFGLLGYLYRSNLYADGTRERTMIPFITTSSNEAKGTSAFGFLHKLFRVESGPEGKTVWLFWMRL